MKISKIEIKDFHQFKDFTLDLTYPKGHSKEGKPLDKVCFIGQSGTGKTTLLELIPKFLFDYNSNLLNRIQPILLDDSIEMDVLYGKESQYKITIKFVKKGSFENLDWVWIDKIEEPIEENQYDYIEYFEKEWLINFALKLIYFPANLNFDLEYSDTENELDDKKIIDFSKEKISSVWNIVLESVQNYQEQELKIRQDISKVVEKASSDLKAIQKAVKKLEDWKKTEFNPIQDIAEKCLDPLLEKYKLRVKTELDFM